MLYFGGGQIPLFNLLAQFPDFSPGDWVAILVAVGGLVTAGLTALGTVRRKQFDDLVQVVESLNKTVKSLQEDNERLEKKADDAESKAEDTQKRADVLADQLKKALLQIEESKDEIEQLNCLNQEKDEQLEALGAALVARETEIKQLRKELNDAVSLRADRLSRIAELEAKTKEQAREIKGLRKQVEELKKRDTGPLDPGVVK